MDEQTLIKNRGTIKAKLTIFSNFVKDVENKTEKTDLDILQFSERLNKVSSLIDEFEHVQASTDAATKDQEKQFRERESFYTDFYAHTAKARHLLNVCEKINVSEHLSVSHSQPEDHLINNIKLPIIQLPQFDGNPQEWLKFRDTFESLMHKNSAITEIQKFHYLRAALQGTATTVIDSLEFSANNYSIAWTALLERFNNEKLLIQNHIKALFNIELITKESSSKLRNLLDVIIKNLRALEQLKESIEYWDTLIIYLISTKLDQNSEKEWERYKSAISIRSTLDDFKTFLRNRADFLETFECSATEKKSSLKYASKGFLATEQRKPFCVFCKKNHYIQKCNDFLRLSNAERMKQIKTLKICSNCLRTGHFSRECRSSHYRKCNQKHHTLLHAEASTEAVASEPNNAAGVVSTSTTCTSIQGVQQVLLSTALVQVFGKNLRLHTLRALLDSGSQSSFITQDVCNSLGLATEPFAHSVSGINPTTMKINSKCIVEVQAQHSAYTLKLVCYTLPSITSNLSSIKIDVQNLNIPTTVRLADPLLFKPDKIDILMGAEVFWNLICVGQISLGPEKPILQKSRFGWLINGTVYEKSSKPIACNFTQDNLQNQLARFWELEDITTKKILSQEESSYEKHFVEHTKQAADGRFIVTLPLKDSVDKLGESRDQAERRFLALERKLNNNETLKAQYTKFMEEYIFSEHMSEVDIEDTNQTSYYIPHHGVLKQDSRTTKLRVVFDCSARTSTGLSLNHLEMVGPAIQPELLTLLIRFRQHEIVVCGDIEKMYQQCVLDPSQRSRDCSGEATQQKT